MTVLPRPRLRLLHFVAWVLTLLLAASLRAQEVEPPRFLLETITVEGPRPAAANIVRSESLLEEGRSYTEDELRQAVYRIKRLPFVLEADFALRRGSERGAYELAIQVRQARKFFYDHSVGLFVFDEPLALESRFPEDSYGQGEGRVGLRQFIGRSGVLFGTFDIAEGFQVGYTHYDLFGRGIVASAGYSAEGVFCCRYRAIPFGLDPSFVSWNFGSSSQASLHLSIPLSVDRSVQMGISERRGGAESRWQVLSGGRFEPESWEDFADGDLTYRTAEAKWVWDTTDHPLVPTRGLSVSAGVEAAEFSARDLTVSRFGPDAQTLFPVPSYQGEEVSLVGAAVRHWPLTARQTVSVKGRVSAGQSRLENFRRADGGVLDTSLDIYGGSVGLQHTWDLWRTRKANDYVDHRFETTVELGTESFSSDVDLGLETSPLERFEAAVAYVFRNQWGRLRFQLAYLDLGEVFQ